MHSTPANAPIKSTWPLRSLTSITREPGAAAHSTMLSWCGYDLNGAALGFVAKIIRRHCRNLTSLTLLFQ